MCNNRTIIPTFSPSFCQIPVGGGGDLPPPPTYNSEPTIISLHEYQCIIIHAKKILIERKDILALKSTAWKKKTISCMSEDYLYKSCMKKYLEITWMISKVIEEKGNSIFDACIREKNTHRSWNFISVRLLIAWTALERLVSNMDIHRCAIFNLNTST